MIHSDWWYLQLCLSVHHTCPSKHWSSSCIDKKWILIIILFLGIVPLLNHALVIWLFNFIQLLWCIILIYEIILCTNKHANNNHMFKIITTTTETAIKATLINHQKDSSTVFLSSWTSSLFLSLISSKENLMRPFADLLVAGKKLLPLYTEEWNPFNLF